MSREWRNQKGQKQKLVPELCSGTDHPPQVSPGGSVSASLRVEVQLPQAMRPRVQLGDEGEDCERRGGR